MAHVEKGHRGRVAVLSAPPTLDEAVAGAMAFIDANAVAPDVGGFMRGSVIRKGRVHLDYDAVIGWQKTQVFLHNRVEQLFDAKRLFIGRSADGLKEKIADEIRAKFTGKNPISGKDKPAMLADITARVTEQRRVLPAAHQHCWTNGQKLNWPRSTPVWSFLHVRPW